MSRPTNKQIAFSIGFLAAKDGKKNIPALSNDWQSLLINITEFGASIPLSDAFSDGWHAGRASMEQLEQLQNTAKSLRECATIAREISARL